MKIIGVLLLLVFITSVNARRRFSCEWCFTDDKCFQGAEEEGVTEECTSCIANECEDELENPLSTQFAAECLQEAWEDECSDSCGNWADDGRVRRCRKCINKCLYFSGDYYRKKRSAEDSETASLTPKKQKWWWSNDTPYCPMVENPDPCRSECVNPSTCWDSESDEFKEKFPEFCLDYIHISCKPDFTDECVLEVVTDPCSRCNLTQDDLVRLDNCAVCIDACIEEAECITNCSKNEYPTDLPCNYCSYMCRLVGSGGGRWPRETCDVSTECTTCVSCDACVETCKTQSALTFENPNTCHCVRISRSGRVLYEDDKRGLIRYLEAPDTQCENEDDEDHDDY